MSSGLVDLNGQPLTSQAQASYGQMPQRRSPMLHNGPQTLDRLFQPMAGNVHARSDKLITGHAYAKGGMQLHVDFIVGANWRLQLKPDWKLLGVDPKVGRQWAKDVERRFHDYADDDRGFVDAEGKRNLTMLMRELVYTHARRNEGFMQSAWVKRLGSKNRTCFKLISPDRISNPYNRANTAKLKYGFKLGRYGRPLSIYAQENHPSEPLISHWREIKMYLPWGRRQVMHLFEPWEDGQVRAVSGLMASLRRLELLDKFQDATLENAIVNAFFAATIESEMDSEIMRQAIMGGEDAAENSDPLLNYIGKTQAYHGDSNKLSMNGTRAAHLLPNESFKLHRANAPGGIGEFESSILRYFCNELGVSYEMLSKDYSKTNYASARAGLAQSFVFFKGRRAIVPQRASNMILTNWLEEQVMEHGLALPPGVTNFYDAQHALTRSRWIGTGKPNIDGLKETKESRERLEIGTTTLEDEIIAQGKDPDEVFEQQKIEQQDLAEQGRLPPWITKKTNIQNPHHCIKR